MNQAYIHLVLNHLPILGSLFGLALLAVGALQRQEVLTRAGLVTVLVAALLCIPVQLTGEGAEELVEDRPGVTHELIHEHEEAAELAFWVLEVTGALALVTLALRGNTRTALLSRLTLLGAAASFGLMVHTGLEGGQINHPEIHGVDGDSGHEEKDGEIRK